MSSELILQAALPGVQQLCSTATDSQSLREALADKLLRLVGADGVALSTTDPALGLLTHTVSRQLPQDVEESYVSVVYPEVDAIEILDLARSGAVLSTDRPRLYDELLAPEGLGERVSVTFSDSRGLWGWACLVRERGSRSFGEPERAFLRTIAPLVADGLRRVSLGGPDPREAGSGHPDAERPGVVVVGEHGRVLLRDVAAALHLDDLAPATGASDVPAPAVAGAVAQLRLRQRQAASTPAAPLHGLLQARGTSGRWYDVSASAAEPGTGARTVLVVIAPRSTPPTGIGRLYGLSPREEEILVRVARGQSTKVIARALGVSTHTVQEYISRASEKVGIRGRKALVAKLFLDGSGGSRPAQGKSPTQR